MTDFDSDFYVPLCHECDNEVFPEDFRDSEAKREFELTGTCQRCQDNWDWEQSEEEGGEG